MSKENVQSLQGVTLVGAGNPQTGDVSEALALAPTLVAADGGATFCDAAGLRPEAIIGDFDSVGPDPETRFPGTTMIRMEEPADQDTTDFEKALSRIRAPFILATGFSGGRVDHAMAVWSVLARRIGPPTLVFTAEDIIFAPPRDLRLDVAPGTRISLFPLVDVTGRSTGLRWPIDGLILSPLGRIGTSNEATGPVEISLDGPGCLVVMPRAVLAAALAALTG